MRNLEERKNEIFRRSQERIARRKKAVRRVVLSCVPVVLCLGVMTGYLALMGLSGAKSEAPESNMMAEGDVPEAAGSDCNYGMLTNGQDAICDCPAEAPEMAPEAFHSQICLEIGRGTRYYNYTDAATVDTFLAMVQVQQVVPETTGEDGRTSGVEGVTGENIVEGEPYSVCLYYPDGVQVWFTLRGNQITSADGTVQLTDEQVRWLHGLMEE